MSTDSPMTSDDLRRYPPRPIHTGVYTSRSLEREMPFAYTLPDAAEHEPNARFPLLVLLHGLNADHRSALTATRIARYASAYRLIVAFPEGGLGWYTNAADGTARHEDDLIEDFLPHLRSTLPLAEPRKAWAVAGMSMGGYGAVKLALKHGLLFGTAMAHSGAFEKPKTPEVHPVFGHPTENASCRLQENPFALAERAMCRWPAERPYLYLSCGTEDFLLDTNRRFRDHLHFIAYPHLYTESPGLHTYPSWDRALRTTLPFLAARIGAERLPLELVKPNREAGSND